VARFEKLRTEATPQLQSVRWLRLASGQRSESLRPKDTVCAIDLPTHRAANAICMCIQYQILGACGQAPVGTESTHERQLAGVLPARDELPAGHLPDATQGEVLAVIC
jgi:hypothetical protein